MDTVHQALSYAIVISHIGPIGHKTEDTVSFRYHQDTRNTNGDAATSHGYDLCQLAIFNAIAGLVIYHLLLTVFLTKDSFQHFYKHDVLSNTFYSAIHNLYSA